MKATTIKVEGNLLEELNGVKPPSQSVSAYVRSLIQHDIRQHKLRESAEQYQAFLATHSEESQLLDEWDAIDLANAPRKKSR
jgi:hypothetical protein